MPILLRMPSQPEPRRVPAAEEPRWGPSTTYRSRPRVLRGGTGDDRRQLPPPSSPRPAGATTDRREPPLPRPGERDARGRVPLGRPPSGGGTTYGRRTSARVRRRRAVAVVALLLVAALVVYPVALGTTALGALQREDALGASAVAGTPGHTYLLVGSDSREGTTIGGDAEGERTDSIILLHVPRWGGPSVLVSIPRDSYVAVPGYYETKINAAFSLGGAPLLVDTVEQATGVKVDDYVETGFTGFADVVDAVGGVEMCPETAIVDPKARLDIEAGCQLMDGDTALGYARTRYEDPRGDLGRGDRQRELMSAIAAKGTSPSLLLNPFRAVPTAGAAGGALTVDDSTGLWDLATFARGMRSASSADGISMTVPVARSDRITNSGQVVDWDEAQAGALWTALREDDTDAVRAIAEAQEAAAS